MREMRDEGPRRSAGCRDGGWVWSQSLTDCNVSRQRRKWEKWLALSQGGLLNAVALLISNCQSKCPPSFFLLCLSLLPFPGSSSLIIPTSLLTSTLPWRHRCHFSPTSAFSPQLWRSSKPRQESRSQKPPAVTPCYRHNMTVLACKNQDCTHTKDGLY